MWLFFFNSVIWQLNLICIKQDLTGIAVIKLIERDASILQQLNKAQVGCASLVFRVRGNSGVSAFKMIEFLPLLAR